MDSSVSSVTLAYLLQNCRLPEFTADTLVIPVQNTTYANFLIRPDNCLIYEEAGIPLDLLVFRDQLNFEELQKTKKLTTSLVDHHMLSANDKVLKDTVVQIIDHRPKDSSMSWNENHVEINIQQVGSCSTLIAEKMLSLREENHLFCREIAYLIYETIIYDTIALLPEHGRTKELDIKIAEKLEHEYNFEEGRKVIYDKLWKAHNDVSNLTPQQMLRKDLKIIETIPVPGLPMLVETFLKIHHSYDAIRLLAEEHNVSLLVLIGLDASNDVRRDVAVYYKKDGEQMKDLLINKLYDKESLRGYNFSFSEVDTDYNDIVCLRQGNTKLSRKQIVPLIKDTVLGL
ncbi:unnamed protein product [Phaedon cochleariae]|uniref:DHHA2 domain-containing protein n=1 Tax=Phaedon cochleariae TaxID=80249 RepID=A0A9P0DS84_PHACE|nr:unnamed protein product [Phaedon cochleariae]